MNLDKEYSLREISTKYKCKTIGSLDIKISCVSSLKNSKLNSISYLTSKKNLLFLDSNKAACIITTSELSASIKPNLLSHQSIMIADNPLLVFTKILNELITKNSSSLLTNTESVGTIIDPSSLISKNASIGDNVLIGKNCIIHPNTTIMDNSIIADNVIIHPGAVIGSDGFGLVISNSSWLKVPQLGNVVIESNVEIGANSTVDRAMLDSTFIYANVKIDDQVHIAHNVSIGKNTAIAACVGIAGSTTIGENCTIGGGAGINGHITIADNVHINAMTMVTKSLHEPGQYASGTTVELASKWRKNQARFKDLDNIVKLIKNNKNGE